LAEFWMMEPEMAFADLKDSMDCAEEMLKYVLKDLLTQLPDEMKFFDSVCQKGVGGFLKGKLIDRIETIISKPFRRLSYSQAIDALAKSKRKFDFKPSWGKDLATEHERYLAEEVCQGPVIVYNYPKGIKAFYMRLNDDNTTVAAMDILFPKCGEIIGGSQREERLGVLQSRMSETGMHQAPLDWFVDLRRFGSVPHAGFGLGFERLILFACGLENIREVISFPNFAGHASA